MASATRTWIALLSMLATSCRAGIADERRQDGRFIEVYSSASRMPCRASIDYADRFIEHWSRQFGVAPPRVRSFVDERLRDQTCDPLPNQVRPDCARGTETYSTGWVQEHELIHAIAYSGFGRAPALFEEGLAEWASGVGDQDGRYVGTPRAELGPLFETAAWNTAPEIYLRYHAAGHFVGYLVQRFGLRAVLRVYDALDPLASRSTIDATIAAQLGVSLDALLAAWRGSTDAPPSGGSMMALLCAQAARTSTTALLSAASGTCSTDVMPQGVEHNAVLQAPPGLLRFRSTDANQWMLIGDCDRNTRRYERWLPHFFFSAYANTLVATNTGSDVRAERVASSPARCEDAVVLDLESLDSARVVADPRSWARVGGERRTWMRLRHANAGALNASVVNDLDMPQSVSTLLRCDSCASDARCVPRLSEPLSISTSPTSTEILMWSTTDAAVTVELSLRR